MIKNRYLINQTLAYFESKQAKISEDKFIKEQKLLQNEEYSKVTYQLKAVIFDLEKALYQKNNKLANELSKKKEELEKQKSNILKNISIEEKFDFDCEDCFDTGLKNGVYCHCFYQTLTNLALEFIGVSQPKLSSFSQNTITPNEKNYLLIEKMQKYANEFDQKSKSLIFSGQPGTGKSFIASAILREVSKKNYNALYLTAYDFNQAMLNYHLANEYEKTIFFDIFTTCDLLVIDDLGTEPILKNVTLEYLLFIISERISQNKPFIITTNLSFENLETRYGQRLFSRLTGKNTVRIEFIGKDLR